MQDIFSIKDKIIIITGGGGGIGNFLALEMQKRSGTVYAVDRIFRSKSKKKNLFTITADITNKKNVTRICENIFNTNKKIDVLINAVGVTLPNSSDKEYSYADWEKTIKTNLTGPFLISQAVIKFMQKQNSGSIINVTSINAELGFPNNPAYVASKGGLKMLTKSLAKDYGKYGIRVNNIGPGYINTKMTEKSYENSKARLARVKQTLLRRWGEVSDLLGPCLFLASDASNYITGQDIYVDGGWLVNGLID